MSIASLPGRTVWHQDILEPHLLTATTVPVPSTQLGLPLKGFSIAPFLLQKRPPFYFTGLVTRVTAECEEVAPTMDEG